MVKGTGKLKMANQASDLPTDSKTTSNKILRPAKSIPFETVKIQQTEAAKLSCYRPKLQNKVCLYPGLKPG